MFLNSKARAHEKEQVNKKEKPVLSPLLFFCLAVFFFLSLSFSQWSTKN